MDTPAITGCCEVAENCSTLDKHTESDVKHALSDTTLINSELGADPVMGYL